MLDETSNLRGGCVPPAGVVDRHASGPCSHQTLRSVRTSCTHSVRTDAALLHAGQNLSFGFGCLVLIIGVLGYVGWSSLGQVRAKVETADIANRLIKEAYVGCMAEQSAAGSEEMAASSEELDSQATTLGQLVARFKTNAVGTDVSTPQTAHVE